MAYVHGKNYYLIPEGAITNRTNVLTKVEKPVALNLAGWTSDIGYINNRNVNVWTIDYSTDMQWYLEVPRDAGYARFHCRGNPAFGLDYYYGNSNPGNCDIYKIVGNEEDSKINFRTVSAGENRYRIQCYRNNTDNDLYLTATGFTNGSNVRWQPLDYSKNSQQIWWLVPIDSIATENMPRKDFLDELYGAFQNTFSLASNFAEIALQNKYNKGSKTIVTDIGTVTATLEYKEEIIIPSSEHCTFSVEFDTSGNIVTKKGTDSISLSSELDTRFIDGFILKDVFNNIALNLGTGDYSVNYKPIGKKATFEIVRNVLTVPDNPTLDISVSVVFTVEIVFNDNINKTFKEVATDVIGIRFMIAMVGVWFSLILGVYTAPRSQLRYVWGTSVGAAFVTSG